MREPEIITRGFIYVKESEDLMRELTEVASSAAMSALGKGGRDAAELKGAGKLRRLPSHTLNLPGFFSGAPPCETAGSAANVVG